MTVGGQWATDSNGRVYPTGRGAGYHNRNNYPFLDADQGALSGSRAFNFSTRINPSPTGDDYSSKVYQVLYWDGNRNAGQQHSSKTIRLGINPLPRTYTGLLCLDGLAFPFDQTDYDDKSHKISFDTGRLRDWSLNQRVKLSIWEVPNKTGDHTSRCADTVPLPVGTGTKIWGVETMTVGTGSGVVGYFSSGSSGFGSLMPDSSISFVGSTSAAYVARLMLTTVSPNQLILRLSIVPSAFSAVLCVDGAPFAFDQDDYSANPEPGPVWSDHGLSWTSDQTVKLTMWQTTTKEADFTSLCAETAQTSGNYVPSPPPGVVVTPPEADAGPDLTGARGATITLQGTGSFNPHGKWYQMAHRWTQPSGTPVELTHPKTFQPASHFGDPRFVIPTDAINAETFTFRLTVTDKEGLSDSDDVTVTVDAQQSAQPTPTACAGPDLTGAPGATVTLQGTCSVNPYGKWWKMAHKWEQLPGSTTVTLTHPKAASLAQDADRFGNPSFVIPESASSGETFVFRLTVTDEQGATASDEVTVTVQ